VKTFFGIAAVCMTFAFFAAPVHVLAQQAEKEIFIDPTMGDVARIPHYVDLQNYKVEWEVRKNGISIVPKVPFSGLQTVDERFITTTEQFNKINRRNEQEITIEWNGLPADNRTHIIEPSTYNLIIYTMPKRGHGETKTLNIPVTIVPPLQDFKVVLSDMRLNKRENKILSVDVSFPQQQASSWRIIIRGDNNEVDIVDRILSEGDDSEFPGFLWQGYSNLKLGRYTVTVEATNRAKNRVSSRGDFWIIDEETASEAREHELAEALAEREQLLTQLHEEIAELVRKWEEEKKNLIGGITDDDLEVHTVHSGETLRSISDKFYGTSFLWGVIYELNRADFPSIDASPHVIVPFMHLRVPRRDALERLGIIRVQ